MRVLSYLVASSIVAGFGGVCDAASVSVTNNTQGYYDGTSGTRTLSFDVAAFGGGSTTITDLDVSIDFEKYDGETFGVNAGYSPYYNEIGFSLAGPDGTSVDLITSPSFNAGSGGFRGVITFDDAATQVVNYDPNSPHAGTFRPIGSLAAFNGTDAVGTFTLTIRDTVGYDHLGFYSSTLAITTADGGTTPPAVPLPPAAIGGGVAMLGRFLLGRRRRRLA